MCRRGSAVASQLCMKIYVEDRPQDRAGQLFGTQVLLYAPFALEMVYPCVTVGAADGAVE